MNLSYCWWIRDTRQRENAVVGERGEHAATRSLTPGFTGIPFQDTNSDHHGVPDGVSGRKVDVARRY